MTQASTGIRAGTVRDGSRWIGALARAAGVGLAIACLTVLYSVTTGPMGLVQVATMMRVLGANVVLLTTAQLVVALVVSRSRRDGRGSDRDPEWAAAGFLATLVVLLDVSGVLEVRDAAVNPARLSIGLRLAFTGAAILGAAVLVASRVQRPATWPAFLRRHLPAAPLVCLELLATTWAVRYLLGRRSDRLAALFLAGALAVVAATTLALRHASPGLRARLVSAAALLAAAWPFGQPLVSAIRVRARENAARASPQRVPSVVLITSDSLRADRLGCYAADATQASLTPRLDRLARQAVRFRRAYSPSSWTEPALATLMTGLAPEAHGITDQAGALGRRLTTLAEVLEQRGYLTAANVSNPLLLPPLGFDQGFVEYVAWPRANLGRSTGGRLLAWLDRAPSTTEMQARWAERWIERRAGRPFFLWLHFYDPHEPYAPPPEYLHWVTAVDKYGQAFAWVGHVRAGTILVDAPRRVWVRSLYDAEVRYVDDSVGRVLDALERQGLYDDALVIVTTDHGEELWDHGSLGHGHAMHEEIIRSPLLVKLPGARHGAVVEQRVSTASLAPTILDICGLPRGTLLAMAPSLAPLLLGEPEVPERPVFVSGRLFHGPQEVVLFDQWKYVHSPLEDEERLYDLRQDPAERDSRAADAAEVIERARGLQVEHQRRAEMAVARIGGERVLDLDEETRDRLRSLGYIH